MQKKVIDLATASERLKGMSHRVDFGGEDYRAVLTELTPELEAAMKELHGLEGDSVAFKAVKRLFSDVKRSRVRTLPATLMARAIDTVIAYHKLEDLGVVNSWANGLQ